MVNIKVIFLKLLHNQRYYYKLNLQEKYLEARKRMTPIQLLVDDLYWEYDRMSSSGKECLDKLAKSLGMGESK